MTYRIEDIRTGVFSHSSGHETDRNARDKENKRIIYKKNKYGNPLFSRLEVAFSQLAQLFLSPLLTPEQYLVVATDDGQEKITGLAVQHLCYVIRAREKIRDPQGPLTFFQIVDPNSKSPCEYQAVAIDDENEEDIPIYFFDQLPQGFFTKLLRASSRKEVTLESNSLASVLATSYTTEEDDLHKGNFGFYLAEVGGKPQVVFFKIDHDLMFVDKIMGFVTRRPFHLFHGPSAFDINVEDILHFPDLKYSANSYWPTKFGFIANPWDNKEYHNFTETMAYKQLSKNNEFLHASWRAFYKHMLISTALIEEALGKSLDRNNEIDSAYLSLVTHAVTTRLAQMRAAFFSIPAFRNFVTNMDEADNLSLLAEIDANNMQEVQLRQTRYREFFASVQEDDTPLHVAIRLNEYRDDETLRMYARYVNYKNFEGKTPLDIALETNNLDCVVHLLKHGAQITPNAAARNIQQLCQGYTLHNPFKQEIRASQNYDTFKKMLQGIGHAHQFSLKRKKMLAADCIRHWFELRYAQAESEQELTQLSEDLYRLKREIAGNMQECTEEAHAPLKYLRQLRSRLWIVRQIRGLYGTSSTQREIEQFIDRMSRDLQEKRAFAGDAEFINPCCC